MGAESRTVVGIDQATLNRALDLVYEHDELALLDAAERRLAVRSLLRETGGGPDLVDEVAAMIDGYGPLTCFMTDPGVTDILVNGPNEIWIERNGRLEATDTTFYDEDSLLRLIRRLVSENGGRVDPARPVADVRLRDGSRMHVVLPPLSPRGPSVSIRRFATRYGLDALVERGMFDETTAARFRRFIEERRTIAISGQTGSGKTTLMNALLSLIDERERVVLIEESSELNPSAPHVVSLLTRPPNVEGAGAVGLEDLFRAALRMRPDRIVVGEVRGREARVALDAMSTGHPGSLVTLHASSARSVRDRFASLAAADSLGAIDHFSRLFDIAFDVVVQLSRSRGLRRVTEVLEVES
jgi:pilus assembly protein CpaF